MAVAQNPVTGTVKSFDRLIRCGQDKNTYALHDSSGKLYDPPDADKKPFLKNGGITGETEVILGLKIPETYQDTMSMADFYLLTHRYNDALTETFKTVLDTSAGELLQDHLLHAGTLQLATGDFDGFLKLYHAFSGTDVLSDEKRFELDLLLAKSFYFQNRYTKTLSALTIIDTASASRLLKDEINFLSLLVFLQRGNFSKVKETAGVIHPDSKRAPFAQKCLNMDTHLPRSKFRSPALAAAFSTLIPGAGYLYAGRKSTALAALIVNTLFIGCAAEAFTHRYYFIGSAAVFLGSGWYLGNIYGSYSSARQYNRSLRSDFISHHLTYP
jgi:TM2 domain-containing membrane protein YozV